MYMKLIDISNIFLKVNKSSNAVSLCLLAIDTSSVLLNFWAIPYQTKPSVRPLPALRGFS